MLPTQGIVLKAVSIHLSAQQWGAQGLSPLPLQGKNQAMVPHHRQNFCPFSWKGRGLSHLKKPPLKLTKQEVWNEGLKKENTSITKSDKKILGP